VNCVGTFFDGWHSKYQKILKKHQQASNVRGIKAKKLDDNFTKDSTYDIQTKCWFSMSERAPEIPVFFMY